MRPPQFMRRRQLRAPQEQGTGGWSGWRGNCNGGRQRVTCIVPYLDCLCRHSFTNSQPVDSAIQDLINGRRFWQKVSDGEG
jgi:hypothetical protein